MADKTYSIQIQAIDMFSKTIGSIGKVANDFTSKIKDAKAKSEKAFEFASNTKVASDGLQKIKDSTFGALSGIAKVGIEFEEKMSKVKALTGGDDINVLTEAARRMGETTSFSASNAADALAVLAMGGKNLKNGIVETAEATLNFAKAAGIEMPRASEILIDISNQYAKSLTAQGIPAVKQSARVVDVLAKAMTSGSVSSETLYESFKYVGPAAASVGISIEESAAAIVLLGNVGIKGSSAGTAISGALTRMADPADKASKMLGKLGVSIKDTKTGNMRKFSDIMGDLSEKTKKMGNIERLQVISTLFGKEASRLAGMSTLMEAGKEGVDEMTKSIRDATDAGLTMATTMGDNVGGKLKELESAEESVDLTIYYLFKDLMKEFIPVLTQVQLAIKGWIKENPNLSKGIVYFIIAIGAISSVLISLIAIIGWVASMYGTWILVSKAVSFIISKMLLGTIKALIPILWSVISAVWSFTAALLANPITWIVIGIIALIAGLVWLYDNVELVRQKFDSFFSLISNLWNNLSGFGKAIVSIFLPFIALPAVIIAEWENIVEFFDNIMPDWIKDLLGRGDVAVNVNETTQNTPLVTKQAAGLNTQNQFTLPTIPTIGEQVKTQNNNSNVMIDFKNLPAGVSVSKDGKSVTQPGNTGFAFGG